MVTSTAQMTPDQIVQKQLEMYNNRDIDGFMSIIAKDITVHEFSSGKILIDGYDACKKNYTNLFEASPKLHSKIVTRTVFDNKVIDHEYITGRKGSDAPIELVLIYEVMHEKITKITVLRKEE